MRSPTHRTSETHETDVLVVGSGMAGWTVARRGQQAGLDVTVVDKGSDGPGRCNARVSQGFLNAAYLGMTEDPAVLKTYAREVTSGVGRDELIDVWADNCGRALDWLRGEGVDIGQLPERRERLYILPFRVSPQGLRDWDRDRGPDRAVTLHAERFAADGGRSFTGSRVVELVVDESGRPIGALVETPDGTVEIRAGAIALTDGGFQANTEMLRRHIGPAADRIKLRSLDSQTGDGIRLARELGAATANMEYFYGHMLSLDALDNDELWPYPLMDGAICDGILVRRDGRRFVDEQIAGAGMSRRAMSGIGVANAVARCADPRDAIAILDAPGWALKGWDSERGEFQGTYPANPTIAERGGRVYQADDLRGLAALAGIDADALAGTVAEYNAAVRDGRADALPVPRSGTPRTVEQGPFVAIPCVPGITYTLGGLLVTPAGQVRSTSGEPIQGLYAAGGTMGGLSGGPRGGYLGGLGEAVVFGLLVAEHISRTLGSTVSGRPPTPLGPSALLQPEGARG